MRTHSEATDAEFMSGSSVHAVEEGSAFASDEARCELDYVCSDLRACIGSLAVAGNSLGSLSVCERDVPVEMCLRTFAYNILMSWSTGDSGVWSVRSLLESLSDEVRESV